jgi:K+-transporting ATPase ATPase C chain
MLLALRQTTIILIIFTIICGGIYPAVVTGVTRALFPEKIEGSLIKNAEGNPIGSELIGQQFNNPKYFWGRVSATSPMPYNASASSGSNLSNSSPALLDSVKARIFALKEAELENKDEIPVDLVTASASGLDPHISIAAAEYQVKRIAKLRGLPEDKVKEIIDKYTEDRIIGIFGEPVVNVLKLNLALDNYNG